MSEERKPSNRRALVETLDMQRRIPINNLQLRLHKSLFGNNRVSVEITRASDAQRSMGRSDIDHPNVIKHWGSTAYSANERAHVYDGLELSLNRLNQIYPLVNPTNSQSTPLFGIVIGQLLQGLWGIKENNYPDCEVHGDLTADNVAIQLFPRLNHKNGLTPDIIDRSQLNVKLLGNSGRVGKEDADFLQDLGSLAENVMMPFFKRQGRLSGFEMLDFLRRVYPDRHWPGCKNFSEKQKLALSNRFLEDYLHSPTEVCMHPIFWPGSKAMGLVCKADALIDALYVDPYINGRKAMKTGVQAFIDSLKKLDAHATGWKDNLDPKIRSLACKFTNWPDLTDGVGILGLIKCMRNVFTHYDEYDANDRVAIAQAFNCSVEAVKANCYEYFRVRVPMLIVHLYGCLELHYVALRNARPKVFSWDLEEFVSPRNRK